MKGAQNSEIIHSVSVCLFFVRLDSAKNTFCTVLNLHFHKIFPIWKHLRSISAYTRTWYEKIQVCTYTKLRNGQSDIHYQLIRYMKINISMQWNCFRNWIAKNTGKILFVFNIYEIKIQIRTTNQILLCVHSKFSTLVCCLYKSNHK